MTVSMVSVKGQIVIPSGIRRSHGIRKGTKVSIIEEGGNIILRPITDEYIDGLRGSLGSGGKALKILAEEKKKERDS